MSLFPLLQMSEPKGYLLDLYSPAVLPITSANISFQRVRVVSSPSCLPLLQYWPNHNFIDYITQHWSMVTLVFYLSYDNLLGGLTADFVIDFEGS